MRITDLLTCYSLVTEHGDVVKKRRHVLEGSFVCVRGVSISPDELIAITPKCEQLLEQKSEPRFVTLYHEICWEKVLQGEQYVTLRRILGLPPAGVVTEKDIAGVAVDGSGLQSAVPCARCGEILGIDEKVDVHTNVEEGRARFTHHGACRNWKLKPWVP